MACQPLYSVIQAASQNHFVSAHYIEAAGQTDGIAPGGDMYGGDAAVGTDDVYFPFCRTDDCQAMVGSGFYSYLIFAVTIHRGGR